MTQQLTTNARNGERGSQDDELPRLRAEIVELRTELEVAQQHLDAAVSVVPTLANIVDPEPDRLLVVADMVRQWRRLEPAAQAAYVGTGGYPTAVGNFAWTYMDSVSDEAFAERPRGDYDDPGKAFSVEDCHWEQHVAALRDLAEGRPIARQVVVIEPGARVAIRQATEEEQRQFNLRAGDGVVELQPLNGAAAVFGAREIVVRVRHRSEEELSTDPELEGAHASEPT